MPVVDLLFAVIGGDESVAWQSDFGTETLWFVLVQQHDGVESVVVLCCLNSSWDEGVWDMHGGGCCCGSWLVGWVGGGRS